MWKDLLVIVMMLVILFITGIYFFMHPRFSYRRQFIELTKWKYAHRGFHDKKQGIYENTLPAFKRACAYGYGIELDVQLTLDKELIVLHDFTLSRTCGINQKVCETSLKQLRSLNVFDSDCTIPTLAEVLSLVNGQVPLIIEIKQAGIDCETCRQITTLLDQYSGLFCVESFNPFVLGWFKNHRPAYLRGQLIGNLSIKQPLKWIAENGLIACISRPDFVAFDVTMKKHFLRWIMKRVFKTPCVAWTIRDARTAAYFSDECAIFEGFEL